MKKHLISLSFLLLILTRCLIGTTDNCIDETPNLKSNTSSMLSTAIVGSLYQDSVHVAVLGEPDVNSGT